MPTIRPRHQITETDRIARAIDEAAERWPEHRGNRARLLVKLIEHGYSTMTTERQHAAAARRVALKDASGSMTGAYGEDYLEELRSEWSA